MHHALDDITAIQEVLQGRPAAYATLVVRYQSYVFTLVMRYVNDRELAEELSQDVFVKAYRFLADFKGGSKFSTWLYTIVHTTCLSHLRKKSEVTVLLDAENIIAITDNNLHQDPSDKLEQKTQRLLLETAMKQLPGTDAELLSLFYLGEQSVDEIGIIMGLTPANVKVRLFRARQKLKDILESRYGMGINWYDK